MSTNDIRQFWVYKGTSNFCSSLELDDSLENEVRSKADGFYDIVSTKDTVDGGLHVIEYSAYQSSQATIATQAEKIRELEDELKYHKERYNQSKRLEALDAENKRLQIDVKALAESRLHLFDEGAKKNDENKRLRTALEFYANEWSWSSHYVENNNDVIAIDFEDTENNVGGKKARKALNPPQAGEMGE